MSDRRHFSPIDRHTANTPMTNTIERQCKLAASSQGRSLGASIAWFSIRMLPFIGVFCPSKVSGQLICRTR